MPPPPARLPPKVEPSVEPKVEPSPKPSVEPRPPLSPPTAEPMSTRLPGREAKGRRLSPIDGLPRLAGPDALTLGRSARLDQRLVKIGRPRCRPRSTTHCIASRFCSCRS